MPFTIDYNAVCDACNTVQPVATFDATTGTEFVPSPPPGWTSAHRGKLYCPKHIVTDILTVDGVVQP